MTTQELTQLAIDGHGGLARWRAISRFSTEISITGAIWTLKGQDRVFADVALEGETRDQRLRILRFPSPEQYVTWEPGRETIEDADGVVLTERLDPASSFAGHTRQTPWDSLHAAYFAGEANWNYFVAPFIFARADVGTEAIGPWTEAGETWERLRVTYPDALVAHCKQQTYYFDADGLLRRLDYSVDILGGGPAVHYPSAYREFDGIQVPTKRLVYVRNPDGTPVLDSVSIDIDVRTVSFD